MERGRTLLLEPYRGRHAQASIYPQIVAPSLTPEQEAEAQRLADALAATTKEDLLRITRLLVSKQDHELLGQTEFEVRDLVHHLGARALHTAINQRKKRATKGRA